MKPQILLVLGILAVLLVSGCSSLGVDGTSIQDMATYPQKYQGQKVTVRGYFANLMAAAYGLLTVKVIKSK